MRSRWNLPVYVVYVVFSCAVIGFVIGQMGLTAPWQHPYRATAVFRTGDGILENNEVFMNGTKVGKIASVQAVGGQARVEMVFEDAHAVPLFQDAQAQVRKKNLLGETYVDVLRGTQDAGTMESGGVIPVEHTLQSVAIDEVLAILDPQTRDRFKLLINGAGDGVTNRGLDMNSEAHSLNQVATSLNAPANLLSVRQQQVEDIVLELQRFYGVLAKQRDQVRDGFKTWNQVMGQLAQQDQGIAVTLQQADSLLQSFDAVLRGEVSNVRTTVERLAPALTSISGFLNQSNDILGALAPYRRSIHDVFPDLGTSFQDTLPSVDQDTGKPIQQHLWSVFGVDCNNPHNPCSGSGGSPVSSSGAPNAVWALAMGGKP